MLTAKQPLRMREQTRHPLTVSTIAHQCCNMKPNMTDLSPDQASSHDMSIHCSGPACLDLLLCQVTLIMLTFVL